MSAALSPTVKYAIAVGHMLKRRVVKGIEQTWCRASKSAQGDGKFAAIIYAATPLQYASAGDSPPTTLPLLSTNLDRLQSSDLIQLFLLLAFLSFLHLFTPSYYNLKLCL